MSLKLCSGPAWGPDGRTIAFASRAGGRNAIYIMPAAGGAARKLYGRKGACEPHFSPDGKRIVYETETNICSIGVDGRDNRPVTWYGGVQRYGRYSPDGKRIVFCQAPSPRGPWQLYVVPAAGGAPTKLTEGASDMHPDWR
jgi:TolB protein